MTDHPSTFNAADTHTGGQTGAVEWNDHASIHLKEDGGGVFNGLKGIHRGTLAEMVAMISRMPEDDRRKYVIEKAGDRRLGLDEIMALAGRADFPG